MAGSGFIYYIYLQEAEEAEAPRTKVDAEAPRTHVFRRLFRLRRNVDNALLAIGLACAVCTAIIQGCEGYLMLKVDPASHYLLLTTHY